MASIWLQTVYGKLAKLVPGVGVKSSDYFRTGTSREFPQTLLSDCTSNAIPVAGNELWPRYPWLTQGSMFHLHAKPDERDVWNYLAHRVAPQIESTVGPERRYYFETQHAVAPIRAVPFGDLFALPSQLTAQPLNIARDDLEPIVVEASPLPLPPGWFDRVRPMLEQIAGGQSYMKVGEDTTPAEFIEDSLRCLACLPGSLRWRVPIYAGLTELSRGAEVSGCVQILRPRTSMGPPRPEGVAYANLVAELAEAAATVQDLLDAVDTRLPMLKAFREWDAVPAQQPWHQAVHSLGEYKVLSQLADGLAAPGLSRMSVMRPQAVREILRRYQQRQGFTADSIEHLKEISRATWATDWSMAAATDDFELSQTILAVASLLSLGAEFDPGRVSIINNVDFPLQFFEAFIAVLDRGLAKPKPAQRTHWARLISDAGSETAANWLRAWWGRSQPLIAWSMIGFCLDDPDASRKLMNDWASGEEIALAARSLIRRECPNPAAFKALVKALDDRIPDGKNLAEKLAVRLEKGGFGMDGSVEPKAELFHVMFTHNLRGLNSIRTKLSPDYLLKQESHRQEVYAQQLARYERFYDNREETQMALASVWSKAPPLDWDEVRPKFSKRLGRTLARLLLEDTDTARLDDLNPDVPLAIACLRHKEHQHRLDRILDVKDKLPKETFRELLKQSERHNIRISAEKMGRAKEFILSLIDGKHGYLPEEVNALEIEVARTIWTGRPSGASHAPVNLNQVKSACLLHEFLAAPPRLTAEVFAEIVSTNYLNVGVGIRNASWHLKPIWRLAMENLDAVRYLLAEEEEVLNRLPLSAVVVLLARDLPLFPAILERFSEQAMREADLNCKDAELLHSRVAYPPLQYQLLRFVLTRLDHFGVRDLRDYMSGVRKPVVVHEWLGLAIKLCKGHEPKYWPLSEWLANGNLALPTSLYSWKRGEMKRYYP